MDPGSEVPQEVAVSLDDSVEFLQRKANSLFVSVSPAEAGDCPLVRLPWAISTTIIHYAGIQDVIALASTCTGLKGLASVGEYWRAACAARFDNLDSVKYDAESLFKMLFWRTEGGSFSALTTVDMASSQDQIDERPDNTLKRSLCARHIGSLSTTGLPAGIAYDPATGLHPCVRYQMTCGCCRGRPCYWSSAPSEKADTDEWISYTMDPALACLITSISITPYTAYWHPGNPTYNPARVKLQLFHGAFPGLGLCYESPEFEVKSEMREQQFVLPRPVLSFGGTARMVLVGKVQRQTLDPDLAETANHYFCCVSHMAVWGHAIPDLLFEPFARNPEAGGGFCTPPTSFRYGPGRPPSPPPIHVSPRPPSPPPAPAGAGAAAAASTGGAELPSQCDDAVTGVAEAPVGWLARRVKVTVWASERALGAWHTAVQRGGGAGAGSAGGCGRGGCGSGNDNGGGGSAGGGITLRLFQNVTFGALREYYAARARLSPARIRFTDLAGVPVEDHQTPLKLGMEDVGELLCVLAPASGEEEPLSDMGGGSCSGRESEQASGGSEGGGEA